VDSIDRQTEERESKPSEKPASGGLMGIGISIFLIAVGAILRFAVTATLAGVNVQTVGLILMIVGIVGLVLSLVFWTAMGAWYPGRSRRYEDCSDGHCTV
jgi:Domain of unknown function (DUF6458)